MNPKILDKIKKCLALAKSSNANEAATALRQAQKLMERHEISGLDLELSGISRADIRACDSQRPPQYLVSLISLVEVAFGVKAIIVQRFDCCDVALIGPGTQPEIASYAYDVLRRQLLRDRTAHIQAQGKRLKRATKTRRGDLFAGAWVYEVSKKVTKFSQGERAVQLIGQYVDREFRSLETTRGREQKHTVRDAASALAGRVAGRKAQLNHAMNGGADQDRLGSSAP